MPGSRAVPLAWTFGVLSLGLLVFNLCYFVFLRGVRPSMVLDRLRRGRVDRILEDPLWRSSVEEFERLNRKVQGRPAVLFVGDSITRGFPVEEYFRFRSDSLLVLNRGINSDTMLGLEARFERNIGNLSVRQLFVMIGTNDLRYRSAQETVARLEALLQRLPQAHVFVESILPTPRGRKGVHENAVEYNRMLQAMCLRHGYTYLDLFTPFAGPGGEMKPAYQVDGVHPSAEGYELWKRLVTPLIGR